MAAVPHGGAAPHRRRRQKHLNPLKHEHIPPHCLENLNSYRYSGVDKSIMSNYVMCYWWNFVVELVPMWVAPNLITLVGFIVSISSTLLLMVLSPSDGNSEVDDGWLYYYAAFALFAYQTLDAIDGKQARRTKSGSPMGELFDHGCDAFFTPLLQVNIAMSLGLPLLQRALLFFIVTTGLLFAIWEQYVTGTLDFGYITGPTEGILITVGVFIVRALYGADVWETKLPPFLRVNQQLPIPSLLSSNATFPIAMESWGDGLVAFIVLAGAATILTNISHVVTRPSVHQRFGVALTSFLPNLLVAVLYAYLLLSHPEIFEANPFVLELAYGFLASYCATRLTVARLCKMPYRPWSLFMLATLALVAPLTLLEQLPDNVQASVIADAIRDQALNINRLFGVVVLFGVGQYLHLIVSVFRQISQSLGIFIFRIKKK